MSTRAPRSRRTIAARLLALAVLLPVVGYGMAALWLTSQETRLVFQAGRPLAQARPAHPFEEVEIPRNGSDEQFAWLMRHKGSSDSWALFLHGHAATVASRVNITRYEQLRSLGLNVFAPEYRGFAGLPGTPSEGGLYADARAGYDYLRGPLGAAPDRIVIYGWSLGGAVAVDLASQVPHAALVLEGAPASLVDIGRQQYPWFPVRLLMRNPFDAIQKIGRVRSPVLFLHSPEDVIVPIEQGRRLFDAAASAKRFVEVRGGHVDAADVDRETFLDSMRSLIATAGLGPAAAVRVPGAPE